MKSVLISIQPKWCELIASGKKTIEVRKTRPKIETPFKCYIYETKQEADWHTYKVPLVGKDRKTKAEIYERKWINRSGKVIGEFVCDSIECVNAKCSDSGIDLFYHDCEKYGCLTQKEIEEYFGVYDEAHRTDLRDMKGNGYAWHISDLKIYDKPKELREFFHPCDGCEKKGSKRCTEENSPCMATVIDRPPQSWCHVES